MYIIMIDDYDSNLVGWTESEDEAIQFCLNENFFYEKLDKLQVTKEIMNRRRFTQTEMCFRSRDLKEWDNTNIRFRYSDKEFKKPTIQYDLNMGWICLCHNSDDKEEAKRIINERFEIIKYNLDKLEDSLEKAKYLRSLEI